MVKEGQAEQGRQQPLRPNQAKNGAGIDDGHGQIQQDAKGGMHPIAEAEGLDHKKGHAQQNRNRGEEKAPLPQEEHAEGKEDIAAERQQNLGIAEKHIPPHAPHADEPADGRQQHEDNGDLGPDAVPLYIEAGSGFFCSFFSNVFCHAIHRPDYKKSDILYHGATL